MTDKESKKLEELCIMHQNDKYSAKFQIEKLLQASKNNEIYKLEDNNEILLSVLPIDIVSNLVSNNLFIEQIITLPLSEIRTLINKGFVLPYELYTNPLFIEKYIQSYNIDEYMKHIIILEKNNYNFSIILQKCINKKFDKIFSHINNDGIFNEFYNMYEKIMKKDYTFNSLPNFLLDIKSKKETKVTDEILKEESYKFYLKCISTRFFKDFSDNVLINLKNIVEFNSKTNIIDINRINNYKKILNFNNLSPEEIKQLYFSLDEKYIEYYYEDFKKCRYTFYNMLNNSFIDLNKLKYEQKYNIRIYELCGEDFYIPIHATSTKRVALQIPLREAKENDAISLSIINQDNLETFENVRDFYCFGLKRLENDNIIHACTEDSYSNKRNKIRYENVIMTPEHFMDNTKKYNEIVYLEDKTIKFDYMICYDEILNNDIEIAKKLNIPIILIKTKYYNSKEKTKIKKVKQYTLVD